MGAKFEIKETKSRFVAIFQGGRQLQVESVKSKEELEEELESLIAKQPKHLVLPIRNTAGKLTFINLVLFLFYEVQEAGEKKTESGIVKPDMNDIVKLHPQKR